IASSGRALRVYQRATSNPSVKRASTASTPANQIMPSHGSTRARRGTRGVLSGALAGSKAAGVALSDDDFSLLATGVVFFIGAGDSTRCVGAAGELIVNDGSAGIVTSNGFTKETTGSASK